MNSEEKDVEQIFTCQLCQMRYDVPLILPCGESVCKKCVQKNFGNDYESIIRPHKSFKCLVCSNMHEMPTNGLPESKTIMKLLNQHSKRVNPSDSLEKLEQSLKELADKRSRVVDLIQNREQLVLNYYDALKDLVEVITQNKIKAYTKASQQLKAEIDEKKAKNVEFLQTSSDVESQMNTLNVLINHIDQIRAEYDRQSGIADQSQLSRAHTLTSRLNNEITMHMNSFQKSIFFDANYVTIIENKEKITSSHIASFQQEVAEISPVSIKSFEKLDIAYSASQDIMRILKVSCLSNGNILFEYASRKIENYLNYDIYNKIGFLVDGVSLRETGICYESTWVKFSDENVLVSYVDNRGLLISIRYDNDVKKQWHQTIINYSSDQVYKSIAMDDKNIYFLNANTCTIDVFNYALKEKTICTRSINFDDKNMLEPLDLILVNELIYVPCKHNQLVVINKTSDNVIRIIQIGELSTSQRHFTNGKLILINESYTQLSSYDLNSLMLKSRQKLEGFNPNIHQIAIHPKTEALSYVDRQTFYYYQQA